MFIHILIHYILRLKIYFEMFMFVWRIELLMLMLSKLVEGEDPKILHIFVG